MKQIVYHLDPVEGAVPPFSAAVETKEFVFVSGTPGIRKDGSYGETIEEQIRDAFVNIREILSLAKLDFSSIIKTTVLLTSQDYVETMNMIYQDTLGKYQMPARTTFIAASLPDPRMLIEIECIAHKLV